MNSTAHPGNYEVLKQALAVVLANIVNYEKTPVRYACYLYTCTHMHALTCKKIVYLHALIFKIMYIVIFDMILYFSSSLFEYQFNEKNNVLRGYDIKPFLPMFMCVCVCVCVCVW